MFFFAAMILWLKLAEKRLAARVRESYGMYYIRRIRPYFSSRLLRAHVYSITRAKHKYNRRDKQQVTARTPLTLRTYGPPQQGTFTVVNTLPAGTTIIEPLTALMPRAPQWENTDAVLADPAWAEELRARLAAAHITMKGPEDEQESSELGRDENSNGQNHSAAQSVHSREGWGNHRGRDREDRRGGLQRAAQRVQARQSTLLDLVRPDDFAIPVPQLRRLPQLAR